MVVVTDAQRIGELGMNGGRLGEKRLYASGHCTSDSGAMIERPVPRQQFMESVGRMSLDHAGEHVAQPGVGFDAVELGRLDQRADHRPAMAAAIAAGEQMILPAESHRTDGTFDRVGVEFDTAVVDEPGQARPSAERIADCSVRSEIARRSRWFSFSRSFIRRAWSVFSPPYSLRQR